MNHEPNEQDEHVTAKSKKSKKEGENQEPSEQEEHKHTGIGLKSLKPAELASCVGARSFLQSALWGRFKARFGWTPLAFSLDWGAGAAPLLVLRRRLGPGFSFAYIPWGPELPENFFTSDEEKKIRLEEIALLLSAHLPRQTVFIRFDPPWYAQGAASPPPIGAPFVRAGADIQPPDSVLLDLSLSDDGLLAQMKPKWRYNIGLAAKKGVRVEEVKDLGAGLDIFYALYTSTARRDRIAIHSLDYYKTLFEESEKEQDTTLRLYLARHEGEPIAAIITLFRGETGTYLYGASAGHKRNLMAPYALQWQAMKDAKAFGCVCYDLFGIAPSDDPAHPMAGLYRFKTGFGGVIIHRPGSWDYPHRPLLYRLFRSAEALRKGLRDAKKKSRRALTDGRA
jgi:lipid II:glycine glycyltransferase (peptidoglycan interpeptide bridge formation enzyme)